MSLFEDWCSKIKIIVSEVDGIITDGLLNYDELGNVVIKSYCKKDFEAINELKKTFKFIFLSSSNTISYNLCRRENIPFFYFPKNKKNGLTKIMLKYGVTPEEIIYIGCSLSDVQCMQLIPFSISPEDGIDEVKTIAYHTLKEYGSAGVISEVYTLLKPEINKRTQ